MTTEEIELFVKRLPYLKRGESYIFHREEGPYRFEYLLPNGEVVVSSNGCELSYDISAIYKAKRVLVENLSDHKYIGIGVYHKYVRDR